MIALPLVRDAPKQQHISYSSLSLYAMCPLRHHFKYVVGLPEETIRSSLVFGRAAHAAFQAHFEHFLVHDAPLSHDALLDAFWASWHEHDPKMIVFNKGEDENSVGRLADRVLSAFERSPMARPQGRIIAIEEELRGRIVPGAPELLARIDLLVETEDALGLIDFKTARTAWSEDDATRSGAQLLLYAELLKGLAGGKPIRLGFAVLTKGKFPDLTIHPVAHDPQQVERMKLVAANIWRAIESKAVYPAESLMSCATCPYRGPCREWKG